MKTNKWLAIIVVLQGLILIGQFTGTTLPSARAEIPDPGARQIQMIDQLTALNAKMERLQSFLESGELQVKAVKPDEDKGGGHK